MIRWRVDLGVRTELRLEPGEERLALISSDGSVETHLRDWPGPSKNALAAHLILKANDPHVAEFRARAELRAILDGLAVVTSAAYEISDEARVIDWSPELTQRQVWHFTTFRPAVAAVLRPSHLETASRLLRASLSAPLTLAINYWARAAENHSAMSRTADYLLLLETLEHLEKLGEHWPPPVSLSLNKARGALHSGTEPEGTTWELLADTLQNAARAAILNAALIPDERTALMGNRPRLQFVAVVVTVEARHADPAEPRIEEFQIDNEAGSGASDLASFDPMARMPVPLPLQGDQKRESIKTLGLRAAEAGKRWPKPS
jgi:hypothetical protein